MTARPTILILAASLALAPALLAQDHAVPRGGGGGGSSGGGGSHPSPGVSSSGGGSSSGSGYSSGSSSSSGSSYVPSTAERRHPRAGTGRGSSGGGYYPGYPGYPGWGGGYYPGWGGGWYYPGYAWGSWWPYGSFGWYGGYYGYPWGGWGGGGGGTVYHRVERESGSLRVLVGGCTTGLVLPACVGNTLAVGAVYDATVGTRSYGRGQCLPTGCSDGTPAADQRGSAGEKRSAPAQKLRGHHRRLVQLADRGQRSSQPPRQRGHVDQVAVDLVSQAKRQFVLAGRLDRHRDRRADLYTRAVHHPPLDHQQVDPRRPGRNDRVQSDGPPGRLGRDGDAFPLLGHRHNDRSFRFALHLCGASHPAVGGGQRC